MNKEILQALLEGKIAIQDVLSLEKQYDAIEHEENLSKGVPFFGSSHNNSSFELVLKSSPFQVSLKRAPFEIILQSSPFQVSLKRAPFEWQFKSSPFEFTLKSSPFNTPLSLNSVAIDSRKAEEGSIFFCIKGNTVDGHEYLEEARNNGAVLAITEKDYTHCPLPYIRVENTIQALGCLASYKREKRTQIVIAVTGSAGKTTVKELLAHILSSTGTVAKNPLNYNNQIGMPLTMLNADINADAWILEVGISEAHDMQELGRILRPDIVYITNAGSAHAEGLGEKGVAYHKASLLSYMKKTGSLYKGKTILPKAFLPKKAKALVKEAKQYPVDTSYFSTSTPVKVLYKGIEETTALGIFTISCDTYPTYTIHIPYTGSFMEENLAGVIALSMYLGLDFPAICSALESAPSVQQRNVILHHKGNFCIDDTYNANPISMRAMIDTLYSLPASLYICVLGDMKELGSLTQKEHYEIGKYLAEYSTIKKTSIFWKGDYASFVQAGLDDSGFIGTYYPTFTTEELEQYITQHLSEPMSILLKGSRSVSLENERDSIYSILGVSK